jgi:tetratricopeptide (TPR) repeat protein
VDPIHETVQITPVIYDSDIEIIHMPESNHASRDFNFFNKLIGKGISLSDKLLGMYARELFVAGSNEDFLKAESYFISMLKKELTAEQLKLIQCVLVRCGRIKNDPALILKHALKNLASGNASAEVCYDLGEYYLINEDYQEAAIWFMNAAFETEAELNIRYSKDFSVEKLAECYEKGGNLEQAIIYRQQAEELRKEFI